MTGGRLERVEQALAEFDQALSQYDAGDLLPRAGLLRFRARVAERAGVRHLRLVKPADSLEQRGVVGTRG